ncbi:MAG: lysophospholipid acyltransferase family protein [Gammaproteobacteria bacterium]|nr:lysophospholipid acyltransferase family protein [Gammaproteobacteria bacterium]
MAHTALKLRYQAILPLLARLPQQLAYPLATRCARYAERSIHPAERPAIRNQMARVFNQSPEAQLDGWVSYHFGMVEREYLDTWVFPRLKNLKAIDQFIRLEGFTPLQQARADGRRVMLTGGHFGHFWMAGIGMNARGVSVGTLTRDGDHNNRHGLPEAEYQFRLKKLAWLQQALGGPFLVSGHHLRPIYRALDQHVMALLIDVPYDYPHPGLVGLPFLGKTGWFADGIARVAKRTNALIFPYYVYEEGRQLVARFSPPIEAAAMAEHDIMAQLVAQLESEILHHPEQWWLWQALPLIWREWPGSD